MLLCNFRTKWERQGTCFLLYPIGKLTDVILNIYLQICIGPHTQKANEFKSTLQSSPLRRNMRSFRDTFYAFLMQCVKVEQLALFQHRTKKKLRALSWKQPAITDCVSPSSIFPFLLYIINYAIFFPWEQFSPQVLNSSNLPQSHQCD